MNCWRWRDVHTDEGVHGLCTNTTHDSLTHAALALFYFISISCTFFFGPSVPVLFGRRTAAVRVLPPALACGAPDPNRENVCTPTVQAASSQRTVVAFLLGSGRPRAAGKRLCVFGQLWVSADRFTPVASPGREMRAAVERGRELRDSRGLPLHSPSHSANKSFPGFGRADGR